MADTVKVRILSKKVTYEGTLLKLGQEVDVPQWVADNWCMSKHAEEVDMNNKSKPKADEGEMVANVKSKDGTPVKNAADAAKTDG